MHNVSQLKLFISSISAHFTDFPIPVIRDYEKLWHLLIESRRIQDTAQKYYKFAS